MLALMCMSQSSLGGACHSGVSRHSRDTPISAEKECRSQACGRGAPLPRQKRNAYWRNVVSLTLIIRRADSSPVILLSSRRKACRRDPGRPCGTSSGGPSFLFTKICRRRHPPIDHARLAEARVMETKGFRTRCSGRFPSGGQRLAPSELHSLGVIVPKRRRPHAFRQRGRVP